MKKSILIIALIICLLSSLFPNPAWASLPANIKTFTFIHVTDLHLGSGAGNKNSPLVIPDILYSYPEAAFIVCGGDMTELGLPEEYQAYLNLLAPFHIPVYHTPGNHESRWTDAGQEYFRRYLGPTYRSWNYGGIHFVTLDSSIAKGQNGHFDKEMLAWLAKDLAALPANTPVVLFTHHPFFFDEGDQEANFSDNDWDLWTTIKDYNILAVFVGHGHRQGFWQVNGLPVIMTKAAMENGYTAITVDSSKQEMTVFTKVINQNGVPTTTQELVKIPLFNTAAIPAIEITAPQTNSILQGSLLLQARLENWNTQPARVEYKLEDNKWQPLEYNANDNTWYKFIDLSTIDDGVRNFWVRAVDQEGKNYVDKRAFLVKQNDKVKVLWEKGTAGGILATPVLGAKYLYIGDSSGKITAFSQDTGKKIWDFQSGGAIVGSATIDGNTLYCGSTDGKVFALTASTGQKLWEYQTSGAVVAQPLIAEDTVLIGSSDFNFYALDRQTGQPKWIFNTGNTIMSKAAYGENTVFFGSWDMNFYAVDSTTGQEKWRQTLGTQIYYAPAASDPLYYNGKVYICTPGNRICALSATDGRIIWEASASSGLSSPIIYNNAFLNNTLSGSIYALDPDTGFNVWQYDTRTSNYGASPVPQGGYLLLNSLSGWICSFNVNDKTLNWSYKTCDNYIFANSVARDNKIFVATLEGKILALQAEAGPQPKPFPQLASIRYNKFRKFE